MSWRAATDAVWVAIAGLICVVTALSQRRGSVLSAGVVVRRLMARPPARAAVLLLWMWVGWHTFAR